MENDIEICVSDSDVNTGSEINFDLITRYYQILTNQLENGGEPQQSPEMFQMIWSQFLITLSALLQAQSALAENQQVQSNIKETVDPETPLNLSKSQQIWSPARTLENQSSCNSTPNLPIFNQTATNSRQGVESPDDPSKTFHNESERDLESSLIKLKCACL
ncbi:CLUMA_CG005756, isoform A [Clunio marinus]|uniref:CLUMA_CG005756, isoform A n=1 Tax=Clunio marinus TaxID=568069 RepID=A0A1J1HY14_9DIPT|nr:CLUMA_CG005756, isoform A [Clunio marinus]